MARTPLLAGNWKMHGTLAETRALLTGLVEHLKRPGGLWDPRRAGAAPSAREVIVAPPFTALATACEIAKGTDIRVAAQDLHWEKKGAFTGEVSAPMLVEFGVTHVIIGHSERRQLFGETDASVRKKVDAAFAHGLRPIVCVGETLEEREAGRTLAVIERQIEAAIKDLGPAESRRLIVAYEPVWAIGTGKVATREQAQEVHAAIRAQARALGLPADELPILYGGSVKPDNVDGLMAEADVDGALVGGASLEVEGFARIVEFQG